MLGDKNITGDNMHYPNLFLLGAAKAGTTSISAWLGRHPEIHLIYNKESNFWRRDYYKGWDWYNKKHLKNYSGEKYILDASTINLMLPYSKYRILDVSPDALFLASFREPISRAHSHWSMLKRWRIGRVGGFDLEMERNYSRIGFSKNLKPIKKIQSEADIMPLEPKGEPYYPMLIEAGLYFENIRPYFRTGRLVWWTTDKLLNSNFYNVFAALDLNCYGFEKTGDFNVASGKSMFFIDEFKRDHPYIFSVFKRQGELLSELLDYDFLDEWGYNDL